MKLDWSYGYSYVYVAETFTPRRQQGSPDIIKEITQKSKKVQPVASSSNIGNKLDTYL